MHTFLVGSYNEFVYKALATLSNDGHHATPRSMPTKELLGVTLEIQDPTDRVMTLPARNANIFATIAETYWFLAGRNDLALVQHYLPRYADYSDDGVSLHGAYGTRMRNWNGVDQLAEVVRILQCDPESRRAVIVLFDPARDFDQQSKDIPCNNWLQFILRDGALHLFVVQRSQDVIWGGTIDVFQWTVLQELVAGWLNAQIGRYIHFIGSLHLYERFYKRAGRILGEPFKPVKAPSLPVDVAYESFGDSITRCLLMEDGMRRREEPQLETLSSTWLRETVRMLWVFNLIRAGQHNEAHAALDLVPDCDLRHAGRLYLQRLPT